MSGGVEGEEESQSVYTWIHHKVYTYIDSTLIA